MELPSLLKAEVKLTTGAHISVATRELEALAVEVDEAAGIVAAIFVGGEPEVDGRWVIVDATSWRDRAGQSVSATHSALVALARMQPRLAPLRTYVDEMWPIFFAGWKDVAARGHEELLVELGRAHREGTIGHRLPRYEVLNVEHRDSFAKLVDNHGEHEAGRLAQDLLAYVIAFAGYGRITNNPIGVPDFVLEGRRNRPAGVTLTLTEGEAARFLRICVSAGESVLADRVRERLRA